MSKKQQPVERLVEIRKLLGLPMGNLKKPLEYFYETMTSLRLLINEVRGVS